MHNKLIPGICTVSLGRSPGGHDILSKATVAANFGFKGIEVHYECIEYLAKSLPGGSTEENVLVAAQRTHDTCRSLGLEIICLQPFGSCDGLTGEELRFETFERLRHWIRTARALGTDMIQIPANFLTSHVTDDKDIIAQDLKRYAQIGLEQSPPIRFAYEAVAWATYIDTWNASWDIVQRVNMRNFGLCLDTFHIAGRIWGDPEAVSGKVAGADHALKESLEKMLLGLDVSKVFYVQAGDAEKLDPPLLPGHAFYHPEQRSRMSWSRNARLFGYEAEKGGYLPITPILDVIINQLGYEGWVCMETFSHELYKSDPEIPSSYAIRGKASWDRMVKALATTPRI